MAKKRVIVPRLSMSLRDALRSLSSDREISQSKIFNEAIEHGISLRDNEERDSEEFGKICVRVEEETYSKVRSLSDQNYISINGMINQMLEEYFEDQNVLRKTKENGNG